MALHRTPLGVVCIVLGALALFVGAILSDAARLLRPDTFADRVVASLADPRVSEVVAEQLTDAVVAQRRDLTAVRPLILAASRDVVESNVFKGVAHTTARRVHGALFSRVGRSVVLSMRDIQLVLRGALAASPSIASAIPDMVAIDRPETLEHPAVRAVLAVMRGGHALAQYAWLALATGLVLLVGGVLLMRDRRDALVAAGAALIVAGVGLWAIRPVGEAIVAALVDTPRVGGAFAGLWSVALAGVPRWGVTYGAIGVVLSAAGSSLLERFDVGDLRWLARRLLTTPVRRSTRLARGAAVTLLGMLAVLAPATALSLLVVVGGLLVAALGLREVFAVVLHATPAHVRLGKAFAASGEGWAVGGVLVLLLAALFVTGIAITSRERAAERPAVAVEACNGAAALCDRPLDGVVFAGTHNAMASADVATWMFPQQERGIAQQLEDGVRALLVDVHYGTPVGNQVRTEFDGGTRRADAERVLGPEAVAAAMRVRDRLIAGEPGARGLYLCHGFCELGALPLDSTLADLRDFLVRNPGEVVLLVVEDYVEPRDLARAFERSGLADLAYRGDAAEPWPTLGAMIARDERLVVLLESGRGDVPWLLPAFEVMQETPYTFTTASDTLSCAPNRGGTRGALFQVNHWIQTTPAPRPSNAAIVNALGALLERARRCQRARGRLPNVIAVDFYRTGALLRAVRVLNGIERDSSARTR